MFDDICMTVQILHEARIGVRVVACHSSVSSLKNLIYNTQDLNLFNQVFSLLLRDAQTID